MKIIVVDDESVIADIIVESIEDEGVEAKAFYSGNQAIKYLESHTADLILSDIKMSDGSGVDLLEYVVNSKNPAAVMLMTGFSKYSADELVSKGAIKIFPKPINFDDVIKEMIDHIKK
jgi:DNA-binding NtrC family response regulator